MDKGRSRIRLVAAAVVSVAALWLAARHAHLEGVRSALAGATFAWLLPYPIICIVLNIIRGEIWRQLLWRKVGSAQAFWAYTVGFLTNNVLPFRLGEAARVVVLATRSQRPVVEVAAAAGLERLLDMAALALMLGLLGPTLVHLPRLRSSATVVVVLVAGALLAVATVVGFRGSITRVVERATRRLPRRAGQIVREGWNDLARSLAVLANPSIGLPAAGGALIVWILTVLSQWLVLRSFQPRAGAADAAFMVAAISLAIALPAAPGFIGVYHWAGQQALISAFPHLYDPSTALAAATVAHGLSYVTSTALGIGGLWYFGMPPSEMQAVLREDRGLHRGVEEAG
jgi:glycosyltransferase 2 family protein